jgi:lambda family phage portal protein
MARMNFIDKAITMFSPGAGLRRLQQRMLLDQVRKYEGASKGRRTKDWKAPVSSAPTEIQRALSELRNRSRDLVRNNPYAKNAVRKIASNVVGSGITPTISIKNGSQEKRVKQLWKDWAETTAIDYDGHFDIYGLEKLAVKTVIEGGECIIRKRVVTDKNLPLPLQLQVLEGDFIDTTKYGTLTDGGYIYYGIEFSKEAKIRAYWLWDHHPGDDLSFTYNLESHRYPVDEIIHIFDKERPGQFRGVPWSHAVMLSIKDLDEYEDAQLVRQKVAACFAGFIHDGSAGVSLPGQATDDGNVLERIEPGIIEVLPPNKQITFNNPPAAEGYGDYTKNVLRRIAVGFGMDYITLTGDLTQVNFSSGRMGWLEFHRSVQEWQYQMMVPMFCNPVWNWFIQIATIAGQIRAEQNINITWSTPRREMIDPEKETGAIIDQMQNGLIPWSQAVLESGYNPDDMLEQMKKDKDNFKTMGLPNYADKSVMGGKAPTQKPNPPAAEE